MDGLIGGPEKKRISSRKKQVLAYSIVLAVCYAAFWLFAGGMGAMGYSFLVQLFTLPLANFIIALLMGLDKSWKGRQWWLLLYFGFGFFLMQYGTFSLANMLSKGSFNLPEWGLFSTGMALALPGMALGSVIRWGRELAARPEGLRRTWLVYGLVWGVCVLVPYLVAFLSWACTCGAVCTHPRERFPFCGEHHPGAVFGGPLWDRPGGRCRDGLLPGQIPGLDPPGKIPAGVRGRILPRRGIGVIFPSLGAFSPSGGCFDARVLSGRDDAALGGPGLGQGGAGKPYPVEGMSEMETSC